MAGAATGRHREIRNMTGLLKNSQRAKALGIKEEQNGAEASTPECALTTGDVVKNKDESKGKVNDPTFNSQRTRVEGGAPES
jgi:hypothetical protein